MAVPYTFGSATTSIPLSQLDSNFATAITLGNTAVQLGNTITTLTGVTNLASSGALTLGSNGNTTAVTIDTSQNVGVGVTPTASSGLYKVVEVGASGNSFRAGTSDQDLYVSCNLYYNSGWKFGGNGYGALYNQYHGTHSWAYTSSNSSGAGASASSLTTAMTLDASGNLGLGVTPSAWGSTTRAIELSATSPSYLAFNSTTNPYGYIYANAYYNGTNNIYKNNGYASVYSINNSGQHQWFNAASGTAGNTITFTQAMTLDASGNLGIGTTSPSGRLHVNSTGAAIAYIQSTLAAGNTNVETRYISTNRSWGVGQNIIQTSSIFEIADLTASATRLAIDSSGNLLVGGTGQVSVERLSVVFAGNNEGGYFSNGSASPTGSGVTVNFFNATGTNGTACILYKGRTAGADRFYVYGNGNVVNTNNSYGALSDVKLKENIVDATPKLEKLNQVRVVNFNLKGDSQKQIGVIAQELEQVFPSMVDESPDKDVDGNDLGTTTKSVKYSVFVPMLIKAIQEQQALITQLQADVAALKA